MTKQNQTRLDQEKPSLKNRVAGGVADRILGKDFSDRARQEVIANIKKDPRAVIRTAGQEVKVRFAKAAGKCGPGWKPGPGGKCVRTKRSALKEGVKGYFLGTRGTERYNERRAQGKGRLAAVGVRSGLNALGMTAATGVVGLEAASGVSALTKPRPKSTQGREKKVGRDRYGDKPLSEGFKKKNLTKEDLEKSRRKARVKNHPDRGRTPEEVARRTKKFQQTEAAYTRAARRSGIKLDSLLKAMMKRNRTRLDQENTSLKDRVMGAVANRVPGTKGKFVKAAGKCGPGWKPGPGGKCVRTKRSIAKKVAIGAGLVAAGAAGATGYQNREKIAEGAAGVSSAVQGGVRDAKQSIKNKSKAAKAERIAKRVEQRAYDKAYGSRMEASFEPKVANFQGRKAAMEAREKFERRAGVKTKRDSMDIQEMTYQEIAEIIAQSQGIRVDSVHEVEDLGRSLSGIASSGGEFFEFEINASSTGILPRPDLTQAANDRARGILAASGIDYRGDSAYEFLRGMEARADNIGAMAGKVKSAIAGGVNRAKQAMGSKPTVSPAQKMPRKATMRSKIARTAARTVIAGAALGGASAGALAYKNRNRKALPPATKKSPALPAASSPKRSGGWKTVNTTAR